MHMVTTPHFALRRRPSCRMWPVKRAPVIPKGWPMAIEPPLTLYLSGSMPSWSREYRHWLAKASLSSQRSISSTFRPWRFNSFGTANTGPIPISSIRQLAGGPGGDVFAGALHRLELGEPFHGRVRPVALVAVDHIVDDALRLRRLVDHFHLGLHR